MNKTFTQLDQRTDRILAAVAQLPVSTETFVELAELGQVLEDAPVKPVVVARLIVTRALGNRTIIEVHEGATFSAFYRIYTQTGNRRSTKRLVRTASRNEGLQPYFRAHLMVPGLKTLAEHWSRQPGVSAVKVRIIRKRAYRKLLSARPDELNMVTSKVNLPLRNFSALSASRQLS